jgi:hypothetical protein
VVVDSEDAQPVDSLVFGNVQEGIEQGVDALQLRSGEYCSWITRLHDLVFVGTPAKTGCGC